MASEKEYPAECPVCGKEFTIMADFLSAGSGVVGRDGVFRVLVSCGGHTADEIRKARSGSR